MDAVVMTIQVLVALTILVGVHEAGHMVAARLFGMRVEKFSIGFPPKLLGFKKGDTEYQLGAVPLGGFVKISGMVDESLDTKNLSADPEPWEFRAKPAWQRLIVMMGGIIVNIVTGILIFIILLNVYGERYIDVSKLEHGIVSNEIGQQIGLQHGDKIQGINGVQMTKLDEIIQEAAMASEGGWFDVERDGEPIRVSIPANLADYFADKQNAGRFVQPNGRFAITGLQKSDDPTPAMQAGLAVGDSLVSLGGRSVATYGDLKTALDTFKGQEVEITFVSKEKGEKIRKAVHIDSTASLGIQLELRISDIYVYEKYSFLETIPRGAAQAFTVLYMNVRGFVKIIKGEMSFRKNVGGPIKIATAFGAEYVPYQFWQLVGMISMVLAFMNFLPIPALDGGHVMFLTYEIISGRKPSDKFLENAQKIGMIILLTLMVFIFGNDIINLF